MFYVVKFLARIVFGIMYKVEIRGRENVPLSGPVLLCANHNRKMDMFFIGYKMKRMVHYMAKEELFKNPLVAAFIRRLGAFPVKRGKGDVSAIKTVYKLLEQEKIVGIFPEGTRMKGKHRDKRNVKPGAAMIAINSGVPILPVAIEGTYKPFSHVRVVFGKMFSLDIQKGKKYTSEEMIQISNEILNRVYSLMEDS